MLLVDKFGEKNLLWVNFQNETDHPVQSVGCKPPSFKPPFGDKPPDFQARFQREKQSIQKESIERESGLSRHLG